LYQVSLQAYNVDGYNSIRKTDFITVSGSSAPKITYVNPGYAKNSGKTTLEISGTGFQNGATVMLRKAGNSDIPGTDITVVPPNKIICSLHLDGVTTGAWDVEITNPNTEKAVSQKSFIIKPVPETDPNHNPQPEELTINSAKSDTWVDPLGEKVNAKIVYEISPSGFSGELSTEIYDKDLKLVSSNNYHSHAVSGGSGEILWDGKIDGIKVNEANNPYFVKLILKKEGQVVTKPNYQKIWVGRPVLIVHGIWDSKNDVETKKLFSEMKKDHYVWVVEYNPLGDISFWENGGKYENIFGNIVDYSKTLNDDIIFIKGLTKAGKVDIVAHSMGGLISRYRIEKQKNGRDDVGKLIMIGTPNHGSEWATAPDLILSQIISSVFPEEIPTILVDKIKQKIKEKAQENVAIYEMMPHSLFLQKLNGNNACDYYIAQGSEIDSINDRTGYYVIASNFNRFPTWTHTHFDFFGKNGETIPSLTWEGDGAVAYNSAKISDVTTFPVPDAFHTGQFANNDVISAVKLKLQMPDNLELPGSSENSRLLHSFSARSSNQNEHLPMFWTNPITTLITDGNTQNFSIQIENDSTSSIFTTQWDSGDLNITFVAPNKTVTYQTLINDSLWYTVESADSGYWEVLVTPVNIPTGGVNFSIQSIQTNPLYIAAASNETLISLGQSYHIDVYVGTKNIPAVGSLVSANITRSDKTLSQLVLYDDGLHNDVLANDGIYGNSYSNTDVSGMYIVDITANGIFLGSPFERRDKYFLTVGERPDLSISLEDLLVSNPTPIAGDSVTITTIVKNIGGGEALNATILFSDTLNNSTTTFAEQTVTIHPGTQQEVSGVWKAKAGNHTLNVAVSPFNTFYETDYSNDNVSVMITVPEPIMNIRVANLTLNPGHSGEVSIFATNLTDIGSVSVAYYFNNTVVQVENVSSDAIDIINQTISPESVRFNGTMKANVTGNTCIGTISVNASDSVAEGTYSTLIVELYDSDESLVVQEIIPGMISIYPEITQPNVNFVGTPLSGEVPLNVQFTDSSTGSPDTWNWSFGDGNFSEIQNPTYTYTSIGYYTVSLNATNTAGSNTTIKTNYINATAPAIQPSPTIGSISPGSGYLNSTINFTLTGANYQTGSSKTWVNFTRGSFKNQNLTVTSVTSTKINGTMIIGPDAPTGPWDLTVTTVNGGTSSTKTGAIVVSKVSAPSIVSLTPSTGAKNTTLNFTLTGTNFQIGTSQTRVRISEDFMDSELDATIISITPTKILGSLNVNGNAIPGLYILEVDTVNGGTVTKSDAFSVGYAQIPTISTIAPASGFRNDTVQYTITGTNFQPGLTTVTFRNQTTNTVLGTSEVSGSTSTKLTGNLTIPAGVPTGFYRVDIRTTDAGVANKRDAFRVETVKPPAIMALTPTSGAKDSIVAFTLTGSNFMLNDKTSVTVLDDTSGTELKTSILSTTPTKIIGSFTIPATAPSGKYRLQVRTTDGGTINKYEAFTVNYLGLPVITSLNPTTGSRNTNVTFTLKGDNFVDGGTVVRMRTTGTTINAYAMSVNTTIITGEFPISTTAGIGSYRLDVITVAGGINNKMNAFSVKA
jgi:PKD repeat protein/pimeloyl-ACP methyl ester carboxylesterase